MKMQCYLPIFNTVSSIKLLSSVAKQPEHEADHLSYWMLILYSFPFRLSLHGAYPLGLPLSFSPFNHT